MDHFCFREYLRSAQLIDFVCEVVGGGVGLEGELKLGDYLLVEQYFESDVRYRDLSGKSALYLYYSVFFGPVLLLIASFHKAFDVVNGSDDIIQF